MRGRQGLSMSPRSLAKPLIYQRFLNFFVGKIDNKKQAKTRGYYRWLFGGYLGVI